MALRGGGIFIPFSMALFIPGRISGFWASVSMLVSTASAVFWEITVPLPVQPLFVGLAVSLLINGLGMILKKKQTQQLSL
jgi:SSS family solute:Na+ symporter